MLKFQYLVTWCEELTHWKRPWCWERLKAGREGDYRRWDGWMASPTAWTWVWASSMSWWWTRKPGVLESMGLQRVGHNWVTEVKRLQDPVQKWKSWSGVWTATGRQTNKFHRSRWVGSCGDTLFLLAAYSKKSHSSVAVISPIGLVLTNDMQRDVWQGILGKIFFPIKRKVHDKKGLLHFPFLFTLDTILWRYNA